MFHILPPTAHDFDWPWSQIEPFYNELEQRPLDATSCDAWLRDWSRLSDLISERFSRLYVALTINTADAAAEQRYNAFLDQIYTRVEAADQRLKQKLLASALTPAGLEVPLRGMRAEAALFREANLPLLNEERKLAAEYDKIIGAQTVAWQGQERTVAQLKPVYQADDRSLREQAWRLTSQRQLADRAAINALWARLLELRLRLAANAGCADYRDYRWQQMWRFDYAPDDCVRFHEAIEQVVVPAAARIYERRRQQLGVATLRPWDLDVDPQGRPALRPFDDVAQLEAHCEAIFEQVDPELGAYFHTMRQERLLDLDNRKGKSPGGYCTSFNSVRRPFIFMNAVGLHDDVQTMLHEGGHAFHVFESAHLPYSYQLSVGTEFAEVASMAMELLAGPYLARAAGGFYDADGVRRARVEHLENIILFWPYMAVVDAFQHWVYAHADEARDPARCDATWAALWHRFMKGVDWSDLDDELVTGWHRKLHIHRIPFYYVEYGLAQLGAVQVWHNALRDRAAAVDSYRRALALGGTAALPDLYATAGARFAFDAPTLREAVALLEQTIAELQGEQPGCTLIG
jgi:oligoendopeptidase F